MGETEGKLDWHPGSFSQENAPKLHFQMEKLLPICFGLHRSQCESPADRFHTWQSHKSNMISITSPNFLTLTIKRAVSPRCSWIAVTFTLHPAPLYLCPVRGWHCSCRSPCQQIRWRVAWGVSSQWSGCVRSWWGAAGSGSTGWRSGSAPRQDQLWQCVWQ